VVSEELADIDHMLKLRRLLFLGFNETIEFPLRNHIGENPWLVLFYDPITHSILDIGRNLYLKLCCSIDWESDFREA
jgi:hypothetical protein